MPSFWKSAKPVKKIFHSPILKTYPTRTHKETRAISLHPSKDSDKDGVMNWYDCKPLNKYKQERIPIIKLPPTRFPNIPPRAREVIPQRIIVKEKPRLQVAQPLLSQPPAITSLPYRIIEREREEGLEEEEKESKEEAKEAREEIKEEVSKLEEQKRIKREEDRLERQIKADKELEEKEMRTRRKRRRRKKHLSEY